MTAFAIVAFFPFSLLAFGRMIVLGTRKHYRQSKIYVGLSEVLHGRMERMFRQGLLGSLSLVPLLASGLLWTTIRVQRSQKQTTAAAGSDFADEQWTFGQVVAVTVFVPVLVEACQLAMSES